MSYHEDELFAELSKWCQSVIHKQIFETYNTFTVPFKKTL